MFADAVYDREKFLVLPDLPGRLQLWAQDRELENYLREEAFTPNPLPEDAPKAQKQQRAAVIGSGPAGLGCAHELRRLGFDVTVFERDDRAGGLLMYGVPNIKLPKALLAEKIAVLADDGVEFKLNTPIDTAEAFTSLQQEYDAVILCPGSTRPKAIPGWEADGCQIFYAKDFLTQVTKDMMNDTQQADLRDKDVVIVGGGDTGVDCAAIAFAQQARSIHQLELQECLRTGNSRENLCQLAANDSTMTYCAKVKELLWDADGNLRAVQAVKVEWISKAAGSLPQPVEVEGSAYELPAQVLILATGFRGPEEQIFSASGVGKTPLGLIAGGGEYFTTTKPGVFAAGDARRGSGVVAWAFNEGRNAAEVCARYLLSK